MSLNTAYTVLRQLCLCYDPSGPPYLQVAHLVHASPCDAIIAFAETYKPQYDVIASMVTAANAENQSASSGATIVPEIEPVPPRMPRGTVGLKPKAKPELKPISPTRRVFVDNTDVPVEAEEPK